MAYDNQPTKNETGKGLQEKCGLLQRMTIKVEAEAVMMSASYLKESLILEIFRDTESTKLAEIDTGYQSGMFGSHLAYKAYDQDMNNRIAEVSHTVG